MGSSVILGAALLPAARAAAHALPTAALALGLEGPLRVGLAGRPLDADAFALGAGTLHEGEAPGAHAIVLVDELSPVGRAFAATHPSVHGGASWLRELRSTAARHAHEIDHPGVLVGIADELLRRASAKVDWRPPPLHWAVERALGTIDEAVAAGMPLPRPLVRGISAAHLRAVFRGDMGRTISAHVRRRRLLVAMRGVGAGVAATHAAHDAGFADSAHLSRTVRAAFGTTLRSLRAGTLLVA